MSQKLSSNSRRYIENSYHLHSIPMSDTKEWSSFLSPLCPVVSFALTGCHCLTASQQAALSVCYQGVVVHLGKAAEEAMVCEHLIWVYTMETQWRLWLSIQVLKVSSPTFSCQTGALIGSTGRKWLDFFSLVSAVSNRQRCFFDWKAMCVCLCMCVCVGMPVSESLSISIHYPSVGPAQNSASPL